MSTLQYIYHLVIFFVNEIKIESLIFPPFYYWFYFRGIFMMYTYIHAPYLLHYNHITVKITVLQQSEIRRLNLTFGLQNQHDARPRVSHILRRASIGPINANRLKTEE